MTSELAQGKLFQTYRFTHFLGEGASGATWRATDPAGAEVAIKLVRDIDVAEVNALASVCHPGVVALIDVGHCPAPHIIMEFAPGQPLHDLYQEVPLEQALCVFAQLVDALAAVHQAGVCHGDLSLMNVIVSPDHRARIVDFGAAGGQGGTFSTAAPERLIGSEATPASTSSPWPCLAGTCLHTRALGVLTQPPQAAVATAPSPRFHRATLALRSSPADVRCGCRSAPHGGRCF